MEIRIKGSPKEIAALVVAIQERREMGERDKRTLERLVNVKFIEENMGSRQK